MNYICTIDYEWHPMNVDMPPVTTDVEFLKPDGTIVKGEIVVEMSGFYAYDRVSPGWRPLDDYTHWRFISGKNYPYYTGNN